MRWFYSQNLILKLQKSCSLVYEKSLDILKYYSTLKLAKDAAAWFQKYLPLRARASSKGNGFLFYDGAFTKK